MKTFKASEELAQLLIKNGLKEVTFSKYPEHHNKILKDGYNPHNSKRIFEVNSDNYVLFDYITIKPFYKNNCNGAEMKVELSENELKSIIVFYKLPHQTRNAYKRKGRSITNLYTEYIYLKENPEYKRANKQTIISVFESIDI